MFSPYTVDEAVVLRKAIILKDNTQAFSHLLSCLSLSEITSQHGPKRPTAGAISISQICTVL
jgi:hypothetical protein